MSRFATPFLLFVALVCSAVPASATPRHLSFRDAFRLAQNIKIPIEWDGVWDSLDSLYDCNDVLQEVEMSRDTLCGGAEFNSLETGSPVVFECTGTADANSADVTCTGFAQVAEDCEVHYSLHIVATRTGETAHVVTESSITYVGAGLGCDFLPDECTRTRAIASRVSPAPTDYCSTPTLPSTLGRIKAHYR
jgi:hypothetical protein